GTEELANLPPGMRVESLGQSFDSGPDAFLDSAAALANLDLVISCDTAIAHLAGALARPTWLALRHAAEWRWLRDRPDSPWYPTFRLFRQTERDDWPTVFQSMERELAAMVDSSSASSQRLVMRLPTPVVPVSWGELVDKITILEIKRER